MARWELLTDVIAREIWDDALLRLNDYSPFQTYGWGQYRRTLGWQPCHWAAFNEQGEIVAMLLGGLRRYPLGLGLVWSEGAPVGDLSACDESLQSAMKETTGLKRLHCRFRCDRERRATDALTLSAHGWSRSWFQLTTSYSMDLDLTHSEEELLAGCDSNWRKNLRRSWRRKLTVRLWEDPSPDEILALFASMEKLKDLGEQHSRAEVANLFSTLKQRMVLYRCDDENGVLLSLLGCIIVGDRATAWLSATNERGRELLASYAVFWGLVQHCQRSEVKHLDLAGIDPVTNNGVYQFKRASGARAVEYLGEWDWASRPWLQWFGNWAISRRQQLRRTESALKKSVHRASSKPSEGDLRSGSELSQPGIA